MPNLDTVRAALQRLDDDKQLLGTVPASGTRAAEHALLRAELAAHQRFVQTVREAVGEPDVI